MMLFGMKAILTAQLEQPMRSFESGLSLGLMLQLNQPLLGEMIFVVYSSMDARCALRSSCARYV